MVKTATKEQHPPQRHTAGRSPRGYGRLEVLAQEKGMAIIEVVKDAIRREHSVYGAAQKLGVSPNTVSYYLRKAGLAFRPIVTIEFYPVTEVVAS
jgi:transcriptional regulator with GAF, ATPase, and Fis domain